MIMDELNLLSENSASAGIVDYTDSIPFEDICRLCISSPSSFEIFSKPTIDIPEFYKIIKLLAHQTDPNDELPKGICQECGERLLQTYEFKLQIENSHCELQKMLIKCEENYDFEEISVIQEYHDSKYYWDNEIAEEISQDNKNSENLEKHTVNIENYEENNEFKEKFNTLDCYENNEIGETLGDVSLETLEDDNIQLLPAPKEIRMLPPEEEMKWAEKLSKWVKKHSEGIPIKSKIKKETIATVEAPKWVYEGETPRLDLLADDPKLKMLKKEKKKYSHICEICGKTYTTLQGLQGHEYMHTGVLKYTCIYCGKKFGNLMSLKSHLKVQHENKQIFTCQICTREFNKKSNLTIHEKIHYENEEIACDLCDKIFKGSYRYKCHMKRNHTDSDPYKCYICDLSYKSNSGRRKHCDTQHGGAGTKPDGIDKDFPYNSHKFISHILENQGSTTNQS